MRALAIVGAFCLLLPSAGRAASPSLGSLETEALATVLAARALTIDEVPHGKIVRHILVANLDVFQPQDGRLLGWLNYFHRTTREEHIRREVLLTPGMVYDERLVDETVRNLRSRSTSSAEDLGLSALAIMVPVKSPSPGAVDLLVVTRDLWSLRFNTDFYHSGGSLIRLVTSLSENNFLGYRKRLSLVLAMNEGNASIGPNFVDPNVLGSRVRLLAAFYGVWARRIGEVALGGREGTSGRLRVEYPLYSLASRYGGFVDGSYFDGVGRVFEDLTLKTIRPGIDEKCVVPGVASDPTAVDCAYQIRTYGISSGVTRSFPRSWVIQRITFGQEFGVQRPGFLTGFSEDLTIRQAFASGAFPASYRTSGLYLRYELFTPHYGVYRNVDTFDLGEDLRAGPYMTIKVGRTAQFLGSDRGYTYSSVDLHWNGTWLGGFQNVGVAWDGRVYEKKIRDQLSRVYLRLLTPTLGGVLRLVCDGSMGVQTDNEHHSPFVVGGEQGLRGYPVNAFSGSIGATSRSSIYYIVHLEARSLPRSFSFLRWGGLVFADAGHAAPRAGDLAIYSDVGFGLRVLIPQLNVEVIRFDWAFPLKDYRTANQVFPAGWPGRLTVGFRQAF
jgi:hypothetical protein